MYPVFGNNIDRSPRLLREVFVTAMQGDTPIDCHQQHTGRSLLTKLRSCNLYHQLASLTLQTQVRESGIN